MSRARAKLVRPASLTQARDALALLAAATLPFFFTLPPWVAAAALALIAWRYALLRGRRVPPGSLWLLGLAAAALAIVVATFRTFGGAEAGSAFLILMVALKALESRSRRDFRLLTMTALLLLAANFLLLRSLPLALYSAAVIWAGATVALRPDAPRAAAWTLARRGGGLLLAALPVAAVLFLLFPRLPGPLFRFAAPQTAAVSGLSEMMEPGSIGALASSDAVAFRVKFEEAVPVPSERYFRGPVFTRYDGRRWLPAPERPGIGFFQPRGRAIRYRVLERSNGTRYLFALALPRTVDTAARFAPDYALLAPDRLWNDIAFSAISYPNYSAGFTLAPRVRAAALELPPGIDPRARALAAQWRRESATPQALVFRALAWFRDKPYYYTLTPPTLSGPNRVDEFLFTTRRGFCEHYASAFAVLMRAAGLPSRIVTGYAGGTVNPYDGWLVVRQADAHAWDEVWFAGRGWVRVDPTAVIPAARVEPSARAAAASGAGAMAGLYAAQGGLLRHIGELWDAANTAWTQYVVGYGPELQQRLLERFGLGGSTPFVLAIAMIAAAFAGGFVVFLLSLLRPRRRASDAPRRLYERWCRRLARRGVARSPYEGPLAFLARIAVARPALYPEAEAVTLLYVRARYGGEIEALAALRRRLPVWRFGRVVRGQAEATTGRRGRG
ncbi:MAG: transglutaminase TgpA family protein [Gammaproteobacteria bacterium]